MQPQDPEEPERKKSLHQPKNRHAPSRVCSGAGKKNEDDASLYTKPPIPTYCFTTLPPFIAALDIRAFQNKSEKSCCRARAPSCVNNIPPAGASENRLPSAAARSHHLSALSALKTPARHRNLRGASSPISTRRPKQQDHTSPLAVVAHARPRLPPPKCRPTRQN